jgi:hypothetical protein
MAGVQFGIGTQSPYQTQQTTPILQSLQIVAQQLQQVQQLTYVQLQQLQQLQQWIQVVPQQIQQLQQQPVAQQSPFGVGAPGLSGLATQPIGSPGIPLQAFPGHVM